MIVSVYSVIKRVKKKPYCKGRNRIAISKTSNKLQLSTDKDFDLRRVDWGRVLCAVGQLKL